MMSDPKDYGDGFSDDLVPVVPIDIAATRTVDEILKAYANTAFGARTLGEAADTLEQMIRDPKCFIVMTLSGAMTVAKMGLVLCEMVDRGWVQVVVSTGALQAHGFVEGSGRTHFKYDPRMNDVELYKKGYDRVYDTLELEKNLNEVEKITKPVMDSIAEGTLMSSQLIHRELGKYLDDTLESDQRAILKSCYLADVPVYVPAFTDSELGLDLELLNQARMREGKERRVFDPYVDLQHYAQHVSIQETTGIFTIGGGVPRNWAQQLGPLIDHINRTLGRDRKNFRFKYGVRICPEPVHWGGLSGCTYSEGVSWGKFIPSQEGGVFSEVYCDATIAWPLLVRAMIERLGDTPVRKKLPQPDSTELRPL